MNVCNSSKLHYSTNKTAFLKEVSFGQFQGSEVTLFELGFIGGLQARVMNYGAIITSLSVPDSTGSLEDIVLGYDSLDEYLSGSPYFGAVVGRYANRISNGKFFLDTHEYSLTVNNGENHLHGGVRGFDKVVWQIESSTVSNDEIVIDLNYVSEDGEEGYPGKLIATVKYTFSKTGLSIEYSAQTNKKTIVNLTHHSYFNLIGALDVEILDHEMEIKADRFLPVDENLIPTGEMRHVDGSPFDFRHPTKIGLMINEDNSQLRRGGGYDHCWVLNENPRLECRKVARVSEKSSGRTMDVYTTEPGLQLYVANFKNGSLSGKGTSKYRGRCAFCLETQHFPDSPNKKTFPSVELEPEEVYFSKTEYRFGIM